MSSSSTRGGRSASPDLFGEARRLILKAQTVGPRALVRTAIACGFLVSWKASGALVVPLVFLVAWSLGSTAVWAYGLPRWVPVLGKKYRGRRALLAARGFVTPSFPAMIRARRAEKKRFSKTLAQWGVVGDVPGNSKLLGIGGEMVPLERMATTLENDVTAHVKSGIRGVPPRQYLDHAEQIKATIGCKEFVVRFVGVDEADLTFLWTERLERRLDVADVPPAPRGQLAYGWRRDGAVAAIPMCLSILVSGMTGSGKSSFVWSLFNDLNRQQLRTDLWCSDNKGGAELRSFADKVDTDENPQRLGPKGHLRVRGYATNVEEAGALISDFFDAMKRRLVEQTYRKWTPEVAAQYPMLMLLIDETVELIKLSDKKLRDQLLTIVSQIRAAGGMVIALTQLSQKSVLDDLRDMFPVRLSLAQRNAINTNMALGDGAEAMGARCSELSIPADAGRGFSFDEGQKGFDAFRAGWCTEDDIADFISQGLAIGAKPGTATEAPTRCAVYRMYSPVGELIYVGITTRANVRERWAEHANPNSKDYKPWFGTPDDPREICWAGDHKPFVEWFTGPDAKQQAERAETIACENEYPKYNDRKNPDSNPLKVKWRDKRRSAAPLGPELARLDAELEAEEVGLDLFATAEPSPEPDRIPELNAEPEPEAEVPEQTMPAPETPEPRSEPEVPEWTPPPAEQRDVAPRRTAPRRPRTPAAARRKPRNVMTLDD